MFVKLEVPYLSREVIREMEQEAYDALRAAVPFANLPEVRDWLTISDYVGPLEEAAHWANAGVEVLVRKARGIAYGGKFDEMRARPAETRIVNVSVSNVGLFDVTEVEVLEDCCTDELQRRLSSGWRIIAACPPNDSRRPDYIIGRIGERF